MLTNPVLSLLFPVGPKQLEATLRWPIEVLWERPRRVAAARLALGRGRRAAGPGGSGSRPRGESRLRRPRPGRGPESARTRADVDCSRGSRPLTQSRLAAGDIGELDARATRVDAARARLRTPSGRVRRHDRARATALLLGRPADAPAFDLQPATEPEAALWPDGRPPARGAGRPAGCARRRDSASKPRPPGSAGSDPGSWRSPRCSTPTARDAKASSSGPASTSACRSSTATRAGRARAAARASARAGRVRGRPAAGGPRAARSLGPVRSGAAVTRGVARPHRRARWRRTWPTRSTSFAEATRRSCSSSRTARRLSEARVRERELAADEQRARARIERAVGRSCCAPQHRELLRGFDLTPRVLRDRRRGCRSAGLRAAAADAGHAPAAAARQGRLAGHRGSPHDHHADAGGGTPARHRDGPRRAARRPADAHARGRRRRPPPARRRT